MGAAYSQDLRDRVLAAYESGKLTHWIAHHFRVSKSWARRVKQRLNENGERSPRVMGGLRVIKVDLELLRQWVKEKPDATTRELHQRMCSARSIQCSESAIGMALLRLGFSFKKRRSMLPNRTGRMSPSAGPHGKRGRRINPPDA